MKKLNRKGFTLIELLAVIVIMAIILVVTLPYILNSVGNARVSSIHNLSRTAAKSYNDMAAADMIAPTDQKQLTSDKIGMTVNSAWQCITADLAKTLGISTADVVLAGTGNTAYNGTETSITNKTCSSIKLTNGIGSAEILLVASDTGKFADAETFVYALSSADNGKENARP